MTAHFNCGRISVFRFVIMVRCAPGLSEASDDSETFIRVSALPMFL